MTAIPPKYQSLKALASDIGVAIPCEANQPISIGDADSVWFIESGAVDLFLLEFHEGTQQSAAQHLLRLEKGSLLPGIVADVQAEEDGGTTLGVIGKGLQGTILKQIPSQALFEVAAKELAKQINSWVNQLMSTLSRFDTRTPRATALVEPGSTATFEPCTLGVRRGVVWLSGAVRGTGLFMGTVAPAERTTADTEPLLPLTRACWLLIFDNVTIKTMSTEDLIESGSLLSALVTFHNLAFRKERLNRQFAIVDDANLERERAQSRYVAATEARNQLYNIFDRPGGSKAEIADQDLFSVLKVIGRHEGIRFQLPVTVKHTEPSLSLSDVLDASGVRARLVKLDHKEKWWRQDNNALLAFCQEDGQPVALLPNLLGGYREVAGETKRVTRVSKARATQLAEEAWVFYRSLPTDEVHASDVLQLALRGASVELLFLVLTGFGIGVLKLGPALMLGFVANLVLTGGNPAGLIPVLVTLLGVGILGALMHLLHRTAIMRIDGRTSTRLEAAFWDRLMRLPPEILNSIASGHLAMTGMTFQHLRDGLHGVVANSLLSILFLLPIFAILLFHNTVFGVILLGFSLVALLIGVYFGVRQMSPFGRMYSAIRRVAGVLFEIVEGITKFRVENAEGSAYALWAREYRKQKRAELRQSRFQDHAKAFSTALPFIASAVFLLAIILTDFRDSSIGTILVLYTVFMVFQYTVARFVESFGTVAAILPALGQMKPLLTIQPDAETAGEAVDNLQGNILFDHVSFRYTPDGPLILDDVTIRAQPGEFVAIAGESGAGKSTLFRLALGIDRPTSGAVYYDGRDLRNLNLRMLRRKIGAVPQSIRLHPQDIWDNIVAHHDERSVEDIWKVARAAQIENEIKSMPMGMMTTVGASGSVVSGGESQRICIARALLGEPRVILFDEATNWLDNENQAEIMQGFSMLTSTRIVIAHRLSTLEQADRIYVMQAGKIVEVGTFEELMDMDGVFKDLVKRQII